MRTVLAFVAMIGFTVMANLLMKSGADHMAGQEHLWIRLLSWRLILGLMCFGIAALIYIAILSWLPLNVAQSFAAAQFIAVILASWLVLGEPITSPQWYGITLITAGIALIGYVRY